MQRRKVFRSHLADTFRGALGNDIFFHNWTHGKDPGEGKKPLSSTPSLNLHDPPWGSWLQLWAVPEEPGVPASRTSWSSTVRHGLPDAPSQERSDHEQPSWWSKQVLSGSRLDGTFRQHRSRYIGQTLLQGGSVKDWWGDRMNDPGPDFVGTARIFG